MVPEMATRDIEHCRWFLKPGYISGMAAFIIVTIGKVETESCIVHDLSPSCEPGQKCSTVTMEHYPSAFAHLPDTYACVHASRDTRTDRRIKRKTVGRTARHTSYIYLVEIVFVPSHHSCCRQPQHRLDLRVPGERWGPNLENLARVPERSHPWQGVTPPRQE